MPCVPLLPSGRIGGSLSRGVVSKLARVAYAVVILGSVGVKFALVDLMHVVVTCMFPVIVKFDEGPYTLDIYNIVAAGSVESDIGRVGNMPVVVGDRASATTVRRAFFPTVAEKADDHQYDKPLGIIHQMEDTISPRPLKVALKVGLTVQSYLKPPAE